MTQDEMELQATVRAQGCAIRALANKLAKPKEPLLKLYADQVTLANKALANAGPIEKNAFRDAWLKLQGELPANF